MNYDKLKALEVAFLQQYPEGFDTEELKKIEKKHKMEKMREYVEENFCNDCFDDTELFMERFTKLISRSSLVSVFEKAKFKDYAKSFSNAEKELLSKGVYEFLYGNQELGFSMQVEVLSTYNIAKWPILTVIGVYSRPESEVLVKPTTAKSILKYFEVKDFSYSPKVNFEFYKNYRKFINDLKTETNKVLHVDNAAYCGFLMMTIGK